MRLPRARQETLRRLAEAVLAGTLRLDPEQDFESFHRDFTTLRGVGDWTAAYVGLRGLGMPDAFPASDLGVLRGLAQGGPRPSPREAHARAERWRPYRAYAALCLWRMG